MNVLIYFTKFGVSIGGSECLPLMLISDLQKRPNVSVTLAVEKPSNFSVVESWYDVKIDWSRLRIEHLYPETFLQRKLNHYLRHYRDYKIRKLAKEHDVCISSANLIDFGKPGYHFIYMQTFDRDFWTKVQVASGMPAPRIARWHYWVDGIRRLVNCVFFGRPRTASQLVCDPQERVYANSEYIRKNMMDYYGMTLPPAFYPPTMFEFGIDDLNRDKNVVYVGRISGEKRNLEIIDIVRRAREKSGLDIQLDMAGAIHHTPYAIQVEAEASRLPWVKLVGQVFGLNKDRLLRSHAFAVHGRRNEEFGISVVEYLKAGVVPIVPREGGAAEVVAESRLCYGSNEEGAAILLRLMRDERFYQEMLIHCRNRAKYFSRESYLRRQSELLSRILGCVQ